MTDFIERIFIGYGSESGHAQALAQRLGEQSFLQPFSPKTQELNTLLQHEPRRGDLLLIISSSFGDGEAPANAEEVIEQLEHYAETRDLRYAIFGLGDTAYPNFCGFTKRLDTVLNQCGAHRVINRVDADVSFEDFFERWLAVVEKVLQGDEQAGRELCLQVTAYREDHAFAAPVLERRHLSARSPYAWHIRLNITDSGMHYRAGDTLYLLPENNNDLLLSLAAWLGNPEAAGALRHRELRQLSKTTLRELSRLTGNEALKALLKVSQRKALEAYLYGADLLDVLEDFCTAETVTLEALQELLPACLPRAYSIASRPDDRIIDLCVREVSYERRGRFRQGAATGWLLGDNAVMRVFTRANPGFWLPQDKSVPLLLIGTGTGIAPIIGLLREQAMERTVKREIWVIFGEKRRNDDFLYQQELEALCENGVIGQLITAFSRDGDSKYYVQDAIDQHASALREVLHRGAHVYLCGNKQHLEGAVETALSKACVGGEEGEETLWQSLSRQERLHLELY